MYLKGVSVALSDRISSEEYEALCQKLEQLKPLARKVKKEPRSIW